MYAKKTLKGGFAPPALSGTLSQFKFELLSVLGGPGAQSLQTRMSV